MDLEATEHKTEARMIAPDVGALVEYGRNSFNTGPGEYRVNSWLRRVLIDHTFTDEFEDVISEILYESCRKFDGYRLQWCLREDATHVSLSGICGAIAPIEQCVVTGMVEWSQAFLEDARNKAIRRGQSGQYVC